MELLCLLFAVSHETLLGIRIKTASKDIKIEKPRHEND